MKYLTKAVQISDLALKRVLPLISVGMREDEVATLLKEALKKAGAEKESFKIIVASGKRSALKHGFATHKKIKKGELLMIDFGALYRGFRSDITRTYVLGKPSKRQEKIFNLVLTAQKKALSKVRAGVKCSTVDMAARDYLIENGYPKAFPHSTGHGIKRKVHEAPKIGAKNHRRLKKGMIITIEPGLYLKGFGGVRIEDMVMVTEKGYQLLTKSPKILKL